MTRVSVIVNNYNYAGYLGASIDSCLAQDWPDTETVVVDDGSTDGSLDVIRRYEGRVRPVLQANGGQLSAFTSGLAASSGEIVIFLDADDVLLPTAARAAVAAFDASTGAVKVGWPLWIIDWEGRRTGGLTPSTAIPRGDLSALVIEQGANCYMSPPTSGNAWTRAFLEQVLPAPHPADFRLAADAYLFTLAPLFGLIEAIDEPHSCYRTHGANGFWRASVEEGVRQALRWHEPSSRAVADELASRGIPSDGHDRANPYIAWLHRLERVVAVVRDAVPPGERFLLADQGEWGARLLTDVAHVPFTERDGVYWGPPADDAAAVAELRRQAARGISHVVVGWPAFWYLDCYPGLLQNLEPVVTTADAHVYRLTVPPSTASSVTP